MSQRIGLDFPPVTFNMTQCASKPQLDLDRHAEYNEPLLRLHFFFKRQNEITGEYLERCESG